MKQPLQEIVKDNATQLRDITLSTVVLLAFPECIEQAHQAIESFNDLSAGLAYTALVWGVPLGYIYAGANIICNIVDIVKGKPTEYSSPQPYSTEPIV